MLGAVFGFGGRLNRLQFFFASLGLGLAVIVLLVPMVFVLVLHRAGGFSPGVGVALLLGVLAILVALWTSLSLQARRIRDIGWNPLLVIPGDIALQVADQLVARAMPHLALGPHRTETLVGALVNLGLALCLLFWPGQGGPAQSAPPATSAKAPKPPKAGKAEPSSAAAPIVAARPAANWAIEGPRTTFGRRGL